MDGTPRADAVGTHGAPGVTLTDPKEVPASAAATQRGLDDSLMRGLAWTGAIKWATQLFSWGSMLVIARILTPADFGLVGMATIYLGLVQLINEFGLGAAIIRQRNLTEDQIAELGGLSAAFGVFLWGVSILVSGFIATFFGEPAVRWIVIALGSTFVLSALRVLPKSLLARELRFKRASALNGIEGLVAPAVTLGLAILGYRYWSIVFGSIAGSFVATGFGLYWRHHRLAFPRGLAKIAEPLKFGWHIVGARVAWYLYSTADFTIVGRMFNKNVLGGYNFAWTLASLPVTRIGDLVAQVTPAIFSAVQDDQAALRRYLLRLTEGLALVTFPFSVGLALVAEDFIHVMLGSQWSVAVVPLRLLAFYAGFRCITLLFPQVLAAVGRSRSQMMLSILGLIVMPPLFFIGGRLGDVAGVAWAWIVGYPIVMFPAFWQVFAITGIRTREYIATLWPAILGTALMAAVVLALQQFVSPDLPRLTSLLLQSSAGALAYGFFLLVSQKHRLRTLRRMMGELRR